MVRGGRGYNSYSGQRDSGSSRGSYRGSSGSNYYNSRNGGRNDSSSSYHSSNHNSSHGGSGSYRSSQYDTYDSRSTRDKHNSHSDRDHKRHYSTSSRDRSDDRKRSRHESSRLDSSYSSSSSSYRREGRQTPPPPPSLSSVSKSSSYRSSTSRRDDSRRSNLGSRSGDSRMGPPKGMAPRSRVMSRNYRGGMNNNRLRGSGGRPVSRISASSRLGTRVGQRPRTSFNSNIQLMRKKLLMARQTDRARRIKIARLQNSLREKARTSDKSRSSKSESRRSRAEKSSKTDGEETTRSKSKSVTSDKKKVKSENDEETAEKTEDEENAEKKEETEKKEGEEDQSETKKDEEGDEKEKTEKRDKKSKERERKSSKRDRKSRSRSVSRSKSSYIKLSCVHCRQRCWTFHEYSRHLLYRPHKMAMRRLVLRQKAQLSTMRLKQRNAQRDLEEQTPKDDMISSEQPNFCFSCRLNYRISKEKHQESEYHKEIKRFLMPYCNICRLSFSSPMVYENHRCSLEHIKRKARTTKRSRSIAEREVDLANFTTVDSVGEVDSEDNLGENKDVLVGTEYVKKTEAYHCELCHMYFPISKDDEETAIKRHCSTRSHLKSYLRFKEDQHLQNEAERVQRKEKEKKDEDTTNEEDKEGNEAETADNQNHHEDDEDMVEDKLWQDVDKDLGDLLREVGPKEDEEDESLVNTDNERFDKFKNTDKNEMNGNGKDEHEEEEEENEKHENEDEEEHEEQEQAEEEEEEEEQEPVKEKKVAKKPDPPPKKEVQKVTKKKTRESVKSETSAAAETK